MKPQTLARSSAHHAVAYPSYQASTVALSPIAVFEGIPTTIFLDRAGRWHTCTPVSTRRSAPSIETSKGMRSMTDLSFFFAGGLNPLLRRFDEVEVA